MRTLTILILGLFISFGCGDGEQANLNDPTEISPEVLEPSLPITSPEPSLPPAPPQSSSSSDTDAQRTGANDLGDVTDVADTSIVDRSRTELIGGDSDRVDYYRFSLAEEREVELRLRTVHQQETNTDLILEDVDGVVIDSSTETRGIVVLEELLQAGTYYVRIEDESEEVSLYLFTYDVSVPGDVSVPEDMSVPDSDGVREGANDLGDITDVADTSITDRSRTELIGGDSDSVDYYRFSLTEEKEVQLWLRAVHEYETHTDLILEDVDGVVIDSSTETRGIVVLEELLQAGTYYVRIEDESQDLTLYLFVYDVSVPGS